MGGGGPCPPGVPRISPWQLPFLTQGQRCRQNIQKTKGRIHLACWERDQLWGGQDSVRTAGSCSTLWTSETRPGEVPPHSCQNNLIRKTGGQVPCGGRKREPPCSVGRNVNPCSHYGNSKAMPQKPNDCRVIQEFHFWAFSKKKKKRTLIHKNKVPYVKLQHYLQ